MTNPTELSRISMIADQITVSEEDLSSARIWFSEIQRQAEIAGETGDQSLPHRTRLKSAASIMLSEIEQRFLQTA